MPDITDAEIEAVLREMLEMFDKLPNPEQYPRQFDYYLRMYQFYKTHSRKN
jgi:hypothetical protein